MTEWSEYMFRLARSRVQFSPPSEKSEIFNLEGGVKSTVQAGP